MIRATLAVLTGLLTFSTASYAVDGLGYHRDAAEVRQTLEVAQQRITAEYNENIRAAYLWVQAEMDEAIAAYDRNLIRGDEKGDMAEELNRRSSRLARIRDARIDQVRAEYDVMTAEYMQQHDRQQELALLEYRRAMNDLCNRYYGTNCSWEN